MKNLLILFIGLSLAFSCNPKKANQAESEEEKVIHDIDKLIEDLPDPSTVAFTIKSIQATYSEVLVNPLSNYEKYVGNIDKMAINMGIYAADVNYLACLGQKDLTMEYARMCHKIGEALGDSAIFENDLLVQIESSIGNEQSLSNLLREMIVKTSVTFEEDHHLNMAGLALAGTFIEEMYHAVNIIENYHGAGLSKEESRAKIEPLVRLVLDQEQPLLDLIALLKDLPADETISDLLIQLNILDRLYKGELATIEQNMKDNPDFMLDKKNMLGVMLEIDQIRAKLIE